MIIVSKRAARELAVYKQGLHSIHRTANTRLALLRTIKRLGVVQIDAINTVSRSQYLVFYSRLGAFDTSVLDRMVYQERVLFEHWVHAASLVPSIWYGRFLPIIESRREERLSRRKQELLGPRPDRFLDAVLEHVRAGGPTSATDLNESKRARTWWSRSPSRMALDLLHYRGELLVANRVNFKCIYDLTTRVLSNAHLDGPQWSEAQFSRWAVLKAVSCLGVATKQHVADYFRLNKDTVGTILDECEREGLLRGVEVEGEDEKYVIARSDIQVLRLVKEHKIAFNRTTLLSPFDNLLWHRDRVERLFGFHYRNLMYLPKNEREPDTGYYVMPILCRSRLIGRVDPALDRGTSTLEIKNLILADGICASGSLIRTLSQTLIDFMTFLGARQIRLDAIAPKELGDALKQSLKAQLT